MVGMDVRRGRARGVAWVGLLFLVVGLVLWGNCLLGSPVPFELGSACPSPEEIANPFPVPLLKGPTAAVGRVEGQFFTTKTGEARYEAPIDVPPGRAGIEPRLAITYESAAGDGPLGVGFAVAGFSVITHCPKNVAQDWEIRGVR